MSAPKFSSVFNLKHKKATSSRDKIPKWREEGKPEA